MSYFDFLEGPLRYYVVMERLQGLELLDALDDVDANEESHPGPSSVCK